MLKANNAEVKMISLPLASKKKFVQIKCLFYSSCLDLYRRHMCHTHTCVCVCVRMCVCISSRAQSHSYESIPCKFACARACVRVCVCVCVSSHYRRSVEVVYVSECMCTCVCVYMVSL